jgi:hypothetical protein
MADAVYVESGGNMKNQYEIDYQQGYDSANDEWLERIDKIRAEIERQEKWLMDNEVSIKNSSANGTQALTWVIETINNLLSEQGDTE